MLSCIMLLVAIDYGAPTQQVRLLPCTRHRSGDGHFEDLPQRRRHPAAGAGAAAQCRGGRPPDQGVQSIFNI